MSNKIRMSNVGDLIRLLNEYPLDSNFSFMTSNTHYMIDFGIESLSADNNGNLVFEKVLKQGGEGFLNVRELGINLTALIMNGSIDEESLVILEDMTLKFVELDEINPMMYFV